MKGVITIVLLVVLGSVIDLSIQQEPIQYAKLPTGFSAYKWSERLSGPRQITRLPNNDLLVLERSSSRISLLWNNNEGYSSAADRATLTTFSGLNHAIIFWRNESNPSTGYLFASTETSVYRWPYTIGSRAPLPAPALIVNGIPTGGHSTRSLELDPSGRLYVSTGSQANVDRNSFRSNIVRFDGIWDSQTRFPISWASGTLYADGLRNEVGVKYDKQTGRMWGVENGVDNLNRADLGGDIHNNNPCEEMNLLPDVSTTNPPNFFGYPYCWSEYILNSSKARGVGAQWAQPEFMNDGVHTDDWCSNTANVIPPRFCLPAHTAPMDLTFYEGQGKWPRIRVGDAVVALHGSWNRQPPQGYKVMRVEMDNGLPVSSESLFEYQGPGDNGANWPYRPVGVAFGECGGYGGCLLISSDTSGDIIAVVHTGGKSLLPSTSTYVTLSTHHNDSARHSGVALLVFAFTAIFVCIGIVAIAIFKGHRK